MSRHPQHLTTRGPPPNEVLGGARGSGFGRDLEQQMCIWENERWNLLDRRFKQSRNGKLDPPHHTSQDGTATSVQQVRPRTERLGNRRRRAAAPPGSRLGSRSANVDLLPARPPAPAHPGMDACRIPTRAGIMMHGTLLRMTDFNPPLWHSQHSQDLSLS